MISSYLSAILVGIAQILAVMSQQLVSITPERAFATTASFAPIMSQEAFIPPIPTIPFKYPLPPIMAKIAHCESGDRQFYENGEVVISKTNDIGRYQINYPIHFEKAKKMGLNIFIESENEAYAIELYNTQGVKPWEASRKGCWGKDASLENVGN